MSRLVAGGGRLGARLGSSFGKGPCNALQTIIDG